MSQWLERFVPFNRLALVQEPTIARKHLHQYPFKEELLREIRIFFARVFEPSSLHHSQPKTKTIPTATAAN